ncbi:hypothetical protein DENSPDRAFT_605301 [Dentipellis sp. KUC8613]|nr:hypothetical protein DENSPDRAFT_605301 [Dentipellis sp. KUC8613]
MLLPILSALFFFTNVFSMYSAQAEIDLRDGGYLAYDGLNSTTLRELDRWAPRPLSLPPACLPTTPSVSPGFLVGAAGTCSDEAPRSHGRDSFQIAFCSLSLSTLSVLNVFSNISRKSRRMPILSAVPGFPLSYLVLLPSIPTTSKISARYFTRISAIWNNYKLCNTPRYLNATFVAFEPILMQGEGLIDEEVVEVFGRLEKKLLCFYHYVLFYKIYPPVSRRHHRRVEC